MHRLFKVAQLRYTKTKTSQTVGLKTETVVTLEGGGGQLDAGGVGALQPPSQQVQLQLQEELIPATTE